MSGLLYKLAIRCIEQYNRYHRSLVDSRDIKRLSRLTYRSSTGWAYLFYGNDAEWSKFSNYQVLEYAIQKLDDYEDKENTVLRKDERNMSLAMKCDRCGKLYEFYDNGDFNGITTIKKFKNQNYIDGNTFDLCPECRASFDKWLHLPEMGKNVIDDNTQSMRRKLYEYCNVTRCAECIFDSRSSCNFYTLSEDAIQDLYKKLMEDESNDRNKVGC